jgi:hypothetical protein
VRIYLPSTVGRLRVALGAGEIRAVNGLAFAVTPSLRAEYEAADVEELEYLAMQDAGVASLRLIAGGPSDEPSLRVVIAGDVDTAVQRPDLDRAAVEIPGPVAWSAVAAVHVDSADVMGAVRDAAAAVDAADLGDLEAQFALGTVEDIELCWYHPSEVAFMVAELGA